MRSGADYIADLRRNPRSVIVDGTSVADVAAHPGFAGAIQTVAAAYDAAALDPDLWVEQDGERFSAKWLIPRSVADLEQRARLHRFWADATFGLMGRTPDYVAGILAASAGHRDVFDRFGQRLGDRVTAFHQEARRHDWHIAYAATPPQVDRSMPAHAQPEPFLYPGIVRELDDGITVRGAQLVATGAAIADWIFITTISPLEPGDEDYAISIVVPVATAGVEIHPRTPSDGAPLRPFDRPLASRFDESDSLVVLRDVFVPWEQVFVHRSIELARAQLVETGAHVLASYQSLVRMVVKLELVAGLAMELADANGVGAIPLVQAELGAELAARSAAMAALATAALVEPVQSGELLLPAPSLIDAGISLQRRWIIDATTALRELAGAGLMAMPSEAAFEAPNKTTDLGRYYASRALAGRDRVALLKAVWDLVGSEFGGRQLQYELFSAGSQHVADRNAFRSYGWERARRQARRLLDLA